MSFSNCFGSGPQDDRGAKHPHRGEGATSGRARTSARKVEGPDGGNGGFEAKLRPPGEWSRHCFVRVSSLPLPGKFFFYRNI